MHQRNAIEGTISELVRAHGLRRSRYRGFAKVELQNLLIATACNIKRWLQATVQSSSSGNASPNCSARVIDAIIRLLSKNWSHFVTDCLLRYKRAPLLAA
jgi:Transposase DDE domain